MATTMTSHKIASRGEWLVARGALLEREKEHTRMGDELARQRRELPWVALEKQYTLQTADGPKTLAELPKARIVVEAFKRRDRGASLVAIQALLAENGIERSIYGVASCCVRGCISARSISASCTTRARTSRSSPIAPCSSGCSGGRSRAGAKPSPSGCWRVWVCCGAGRADREW